MFKTDKWCELRSFTLSAYFKRHMGIPMGKGRGLKLRIKKAHLGEPFKCEALAEI